MRNDFPSGRGGSPSGQRSPFLFANKRRPQRKSPGIPGFSAKGFKFTYLYSGISASTSLLAPDAIATSTNLSGAVTDIDENPDSADANWLTASVATSDTEVRVTFPTPTGSLTSGVGLQEFRVQLRKTTGTQTPTVNVELYENGSFVSTLLSSTSITSTSGQVLSATWNAASLSGLAGTNVECRVAGTAGTTPGAQPAFGTSGTVNQSAALAGSYDVNIPAHTSGDLLLLCSQSNNTNGDALLSTINTSGWTWVGGSGQNYGASNGSNARVAVAWKIGDGSETIVNVTHTGGATVPRHCDIVLRFTATNGFAATPIQNVSSSFALASTTISPPTVTPGSTNERAICLMGSMFNQSGWLAPTGESGGDWTEVIGEQRGTGGTFGFLIADVSSGGAISGGTSTIGSGDWTCVGFTIVPAGVGVNTVEVGAIGWNAGVQTTAGGGSSSGAATTLYSHVSTYVPSGGGVSSGTAAISRIYAPSISGGGVSSGTADLSKIKDYHPTGAGGTPSGAAITALVQDVYSTGGAQGNPRGTRPRHIGHRRFGGPIGISVKGFTFTYLSAQSGGAVSSGSGDVLKEKSYPSSGGGISSGSAATAPTALHTYLPSGTGVSSGTAPVSTVKNYLASGTALSSGAAAIDFQPVVFNTGGKQASPLGRRPFRSRRRLFGGAPGLQLRPTVPVQIAGVTFAYTGSGGGISSGAVIGIREYAPSLSGGGISDGVGAINRVWAPTGAGTGVSSGTAGLNRTWARDGAGGGTSSGNAETSWIPLATPGIFLSGPAAHPRGTHPFLMRRRRFGAPPGRSVTRQVWDFRALQVTYAYVASAGAVSSGSADIARTRAVAAQGGASSSGAAAIALTHAPPTSGGGNSTGSGGINRVWAPTGTGTGVSSGSATLTRTKVYPPSGGGVSAGTAAHARSRTWQPFGGGIFGGAAATQYRPGAVFQPGAPAWTAKTVYSTWMAQKPVFGWTASARELKWQGEVLPTNAIWTAQPATFSWSAQPAMLKWQAKTAELA